MNTNRRYSLEVREQAVRLVTEHQEKYPSRWAAICSISGKIGCTLGTLRTFCKQTDDTQVKNSGAQANHKRMNQLERENRDLKRDNETLRKAAAFFAQAELDRKPK